MVNWLHGASMILGVSWRIMVDLSSKHIGQRENKLSKYGPSQRYGWWNCCSRLPPVRFVLPWKQRDCL